MGLIVNFPPDGRLHMKRSALPVSGNADILFFTGVRYARREAPASGNDSPSPQKADRRPRRRKARSA